MARDRLDRVLLQRGFAPSRERAPALILAGRVLVQEQKIEKPGVLVDVESEIRLLGGDLRYVSRGGLKLEEALRYWKIDVTGVVGVDIGTSTGGFTDCMLQHGAARVLAVDTGYGQIAEGLRRDERVVLHERTNARLLAPGALATEPGGLPSFLAMDVSFISATLVLPAVLRAMALPGTSWQGRAVVLVKPQFEVGPGRVVKGVVKDETLRVQACDAVAAVVSAAGWDLLGLHLELFSPKRTADKLKFLAGSESAMGAFISDVTPEQTAGRLRDA